MRCNDRNDDLITRLTISIDFFNAHYLKQIRLSLCLKFLPLCHFEKVKGVFITVISAVKPIVELLLQYSDNRKGDLKSRVSEKHKNSKRCLRPNMMKLISKKAINS